MTLGRLERSSIWLPCGRKLLKLVDLGEPTSFFFTTYCWHALNVNANRTKSLLTNTEKRSNHEFPQQQLENYQGARNFTQKRSHGPTTWIVMRKSALKDIANWRTKKRQRVVVQSLNPLLRWSQFPPQIVLKCLYSARIGRADIFVVRKMARAVTKWTRNLWQTLSSFDFRHSSRKWLPTTLSCGKHASAMSIGFIPRLRFCWRPWGLQIKIRWSLVYFRKLDVHETDFSFTHSATESEVISLDAGLRMDKILALDLWDVVIDRSVTFIEEYLITTHQAARNCWQNHKSKQQGDTVMLINCRKRTTSSQTQILLKAGLSCSCLKAMKQRSRWSSKIEAQWWDTCLDTTDLR